MSAHFSNINLSQIVRVSFTNTHLLVAVEPIPFRAWRQASLPRRMVLPRPTQKLLLSQAGRFVAHVESTATCTTSLLFCLHHDVCVDILNDMFR